MVVDAANIVLIVCHKTGGHHGGDLLPQLPLDVFIALRDVKGQLDSLREPLLNLCDQPIDLVVFIDDMAAPDAFLLRVDEDLAQTVLHILVAVFGEGTDLHVVLSLLQLGDIVILLSHQGLVDAAIVPSERLLLDRPLKLGVILAQLLEVRLLQHVDDHACGGLVYEVEPLAEAELEQANDG